MTVTLRINTRNDIHLPAKLLRRFNVGEERIVKARLKGNVLSLIPVDLEPRYAPEALEGLDRLHADEESKGWIPLDSPAAIDRLVK